MNRLCQMAFAVVLSAWCVGCSTQASVDAPCRPPDAAVSAAEALDHALCVVPDLAETDLVMLGAAAEYDPSGTGKFSSWEFEFRDGDVRRAVSISAGRAIGVAASPAGSALGCASGTLKVADTTTLVPMARSLVSLDAEDESTVTGFQHHLGCGEWSEYPGFLKPTVLFAHIDWESDAYTYVVFEDDGQVAQVCDSTACHAGNSATCCESSN